MANYREPQWLLPNEKNLAMPASDATVGSGLAEDRQSLYSMDFDGSNYIDLGTGLDIFKYNVNESYTISLWYKTTVAGGFKTLINLGANTYRFCLLSATLGRITFGAGNSSTITVTYNWMPTAGAINDGNWHHICIVQDSSGGSVNLTPYVDGSPSGSAAGTTPAVTENNNRIGDGHYGGVDGNIDEVAIFSRALSASEVTTLYNSGAPGNLMALDNKPYAYYPLGEQARRGSEWQFPNEVLQSQVFDFDGTDDVVDLGTGLIGDGTKSISFWIKRNSGSPSNDGGIFTIVESGSPSSYISIALWQDLIQSSIGNSTNHKGSTTIAVDTWYHVMVVKDSSATTAIYVNGVAETLSTGGSWVGAIDQPQAKIGGISYSSTSYNFQGEISNVAVWYSDQSTNIANIYNNGSPQSSYTTTPTAWYKLNATSNYAGLNPNFHNALSFDGSSDYIDAGNPTELQLTGALTFSGWIKTSSATYQLMISKDDVTNRCYNFGLLNTGEVYGQVFSSGSATTVQTTTTWKDGNWHHIAFVYIPSTSMEIFIDGNSEILSTSSIPASIDNDPANFNIGRRTDGARYFNGSLSNVAIWTQAISAEDVLYLYNGGTPQTSLSFEPLSWWKLDNLTTGIQDSGSASNNGTNNGATEVTDSVAVDQWNFDNVAHAQTPNFTSTLQYDPAGSGEYSSIPFSSSKTVEAISLWYNSTAAAGTNQQLISFVDSFSAPYSALGLSLNASGYVVIMFIQHLPTPFPAGYTVYNGGEPTGWNNLVINYNTGTSKYDMYLNGSKLSTTTAAGTGTVSTDGLLIGNRSSSNLPFDGFISNVCIFTSSLGATGSNSIETIYNNGTPLTSMSGFTSLDGWWTLKDTSTSVGGGLYDSSSNSNNASANTASKGITNVLTPRLNGESTTLPTTALVSSDLQFESPYSNFSLDFDGIGNNLNLGDVQNNTSLTFSSWINTTSTNASSYQNIAWKRNGSTGWFIQYLYGSGTDGKIKFYIFHTNGAGTGSEVTITNLQSGNWFNISLTYDGTDAIGALKLYSNGIEVYSNPSTLGGTGIAVNSDNLYLGGGATSAWFGCKMDEVAIWGSALTQAQVTQIYNNGYPSNLTSLSPSNWWRLGEDAYFVSNDLRVPNQISGGNIAEGYGTQTTMLVADAPGSYASGVGSSLVVADRIGDAPESTANSLSVNMIPSNRISYPSGYVPTQVDNVYSMDFDGVSGQNVNLGTISSLNSASAFTISFWSNFDTPQTNDGVIFTNRVDNNNRITIYRYNTSIYFHINSSGSNQGNVTAPSTGSWAHIAMVYDGSGSANADRLKVYFDGVEQTLSYGGTIPATTGTYSTSYLGARGDGTNEYHGKLDEVAIFDYALSARQIKQDIYEGTTTGKTADLNNISNLTAPVAWYRMGD